MREGGKAGPVLTKASTGAASEPITGVLPDICGNALMRLALKRDQETRTRSPAVRAAGQKPVSMRWKTTLVKVDICAPTKGAETATVIRMATILGTKVRVIS